MLLPSMFAGLPLALSARAGALRPSAPSLKICRRFCAQAERRRRVPLTPCWLPGGKGRASIARSRADLQRWKYVDVATLHGVLVTRLPLTLACSACAVPPARCSTNRAGLGLCSGRGWNTRSSWAMAHGCKDVGGSSSS